MTFEKLCELRELRTISKDKRLCLKPEEVDELLDEAWRLRIVIQVLEATLSLWRVLKSKGEPPGGILLRQHAAAEEALRTVDGGI